MQKMRGKEVRGEEQSERDEGCERERKEEGVLDTWTCK